MASRLEGYTVLVTGSGGFLGRRVVAALLAQGAAVVATDVRGDDGGFAPADSRDKYRFLPGGFDVAATQAAALMKSTGRGQTAVLHLAGMAHAGECQASPAAAFEANVALTFRVLEFCRSHGVGKFVFPSTGLVYPEGLGRPAAETDAPAPRSIYAVTKLAAEDLVRGYAAMGLCAVIARLANVYGPGGHPDTVAGTAIQQARLGGEIALRDPAAVRDFIFADDVAEGLLRLLVSVESGCTTANLSTGVGTSARDLAEAARRAAGRAGAGVKMPGPASAGASSSLVLDNTLLVRLTGWRPPHDIDAGMAKALRG